MQTDVETRARACAHASQEVLKTLYKYTARMDTESVCAVVDAVHAGSRRLRGQPRSAGRPMAVGIAPGRSNDQPWSEGPSAQRLAHLFGRETPEELARVVDLSNVHPTATYTKGQKRTELRAGFAGRPFVVVVGREAAEALGLGALREFEPTKACGTMVVAIPHTSGKCRWWNDPANCARAVTFFNGLLAGCRGLRRNVKQGD
jgi:hypothetical protein